MQNFLKPLIAIYLALLSSIAPGQSIDSTDVDFDEDSNLYVTNEIVVKFHPALVNTLIVNDTTIQTGIVSDFIDPYLLDMLIDSDLFNVSLADLAISKVFSNLTVSDSISISRTGDTVAIPKFWSTFVITWNDDVGVAFLDALDTLNKMWPAVEYAHLNYMGDIGALPNDSRFTAGDQAGLVPTVAKPNGSINLEPAWDLSVGQSNCKVGFYGTGINWDHDDFSEDGSHNWNKSRVKGGWDWSKNAHPSANLEHDDNNHETLVEALWEQFGIIIWDVQA